MHKGAAPKFGLPQPEPILVALKKKIIKKKYKSPIFFFFWVQNQGSIYIYIKFSKKKIIYIYT
jgi:hypothetical protein